jgi:hypothetical protein
MLGPWGVERRPAGVGTWGRMAGSRWRLAWVVCGPPAYCRARFGWCVAGVWRGRLVTLRSRGVAAAAARLSPRGTAGVAGAWPGEVCGQPAYCRARFGWCVAGAWLGRRVAIRSRGVAVQGRVLAVTVNPAMAGGVQMWCVVAFGVVAWSRSAPEGSRFNDGSRVRCGVAPTQSSVLRTFNSSRGGWRLAWSPGHDPLPRGRGSGACPGGDSAPRHGWRGTDVVCRGGWRGAVSLGHDPLPRGRGSTSGRGARAT